MSVDYRISFKDGTSCEVIDAACFGDLKYIEDKRNWEEISGDVPLTDVVYMIGKDLSILNNTVLERFVHGEGEVFVRGEYEGDAMISMLSFIRYLCNGRRDVPQSIDGVGISPLRKVLYAELLRAGEYHSSYHSDKYIYSDDEETVFDMKRLTLPDALAAIIVFEKMGRVYKGYQEPMEFSSGYVRDEYECDIGESITGYWQAPAISGKRLGGTESLGFHHIMASSFYGPDTTEVSFLKGVHTLIEQCLIEAMDSLKSGKYDDVINKWLENPTYDNLPEDVRTRNLCLLKQNLLRECHED